MKWLEPNLDFGEVILRVILTVNLAGIIRWLELDYFVFIPFLVVVTVLSGFCPVKYAIWRLKINVRERRRSHENTGTDYTNGWQSPCEVMWKTGGF